MDLNPDIQPGRAHEVNVLNRDPLAEVCGRSLLEVGAGDLDDQPFARVPIGRGAGIHDRCGSHRRLGERDRRRIRDRQPIDKALIPIHEMAHEYECAVKIAVHHNKVNFKNPDAVVDILGSTAKGANADTIWGIYRQRGVRGGKLQVVGRDVDETTLQITFDKQTACWQSEGVVDETFMEMTPHRDKLLKVIREEGGRSNNDLARITGINRGSVSRNLAILCEAGYIERGKDNLYYITTSTTGTTPTTSQQPILF